MKNTRMILSALLLVCLMALSAACSTSYRVLHIEDHPAGQATLMQTHTTKHMLGGLYNESRHNYWECQRTQVGLDCHKTCYNPDTFGKFPETMADEDLACFGYGTVAQ